MTKQIALLSIASTAALGMSLATANHTPRHHAVNHLYVGADIGAVYDTELDIPSDGGFFGDDAVTGHSHTPWGLTGSIFTGYELNKHWAVQAGYIVNQTQSADFTDTDDSVQTLKHQQKNFYLAIKASLPVSGQYSAYLMAGPSRSAYSLKASVAGVSGSETIKDHRWVPMAAAGMTYAVNDCLDVSLQYMFTVANMRSLQSTRFSTEDDVANKLFSDASTHRVTVGVSYQFDV